MDPSDFHPPYQPTPIPPPSSLTSYSLSPTNGRLEYLEAAIHQRHLNTGAALSPSIASFLLLSDHRLGDTPSLIIPASLGGPGDEVYNAFLRGQGFDATEWENDIEREVYHAVKEGGTVRVIVRFLFRDLMVTRPYKIRYRVELGGGGVIENELLNL